MLSAELPPCRDLFNRATLELTCKMLRKRRPTLALQIQNALVLSYPRDNYHLALSATELPLSPAVAEQIVQALAALSNNVGNNVNAPLKLNSRVSAPCPGDELVLVRSLLLDWLMFARAQCEEQEQPAA